MGSLADKELAGIDHVHGVVGWVENTALVVGAVVTFYRWGFTRGLTIAQREFSEGFMDAATGSEGE